MIYHKTSKQQSQNTCGLHRNVKCNTHTTLLQQISERSYASLRHLSVFSTSEIAAVSINCKNNYSNRVKEILPLAWNVSAEHKQQHKLTANATTIQTLTEVNK